MEVRTLALKLYTLHGCPYSIQADFVLLGDYGAINVMLAWIFRTIRKVMECRDARPYSSHTRPIADNTINDVRPDSAPICDRVFLKYNY